MGDGGVHEQAQATIAPQYRNAARPVISIRIGIRIGIRARARGGHPATQLGDT